MIKELQNITNFISVNKVNLTEKINSINEYVANLTNWHIIEPINVSMIYEETSRVLLNIIYFKDKWKQKFDVMNTLTKQFYSSTVNKSVEMMYMYNKHQFYHENEMFQILEMSYVHEEFRMGFILPKHSYNVPTLSSANLNELMDNLLDADIEAYSNSQI